MKKIEYICDCCGKNATENYYTIDIHQHPDSLGRYTTLGAANNLKYNTRKIFGTERIYCQSCIDFVEQKIKKKKYQI